MRDAARMTPSVCGRAFRLGLNARLNARPAGLGQSGPHPGNRVPVGTGEGNRLVITTTHMKYCVIQRNGVASSAHAVMTEHFIRHGDYLTLVSIVDDPAYLESDIRKAATEIATASKTDLAQPGRVMADVAKELRTADAERWTRRNEAMERLAR